MIYQTARVRTSVGFSPVRLGGADDRRSPFCGAAYSWMGCGGGKRMKRMDEADGVEEDAQDG